MAYERTNWINGTTPLNATNMNNIEDGIAEVQVDEEVITIYQNLGVVFDE